MLNNITNTSIGIAKIAGKGIFKHIFFIGFSILTFCLGLFLISQSDGNGTTAAGHAGGAGAVAGIIVLLASAFWPTLLMIVSFVFIFLYFGLINKGIVHSSLFKLWKENLEDWFLNKITEYTDHYFSGGNKISEINDKATLKLRLVNDIKNDTTNSKWQTKILSFILKKIQFEDFDFEDPDFKISDFLAEKATDFVTEIGEPSNRPLYIMFAFQVLLLIVAIIF